MKELDSPLSDEIGIVVDEAFREVVDEHWVESIALQVLRTEGVAQPYELSLVFTDSETVQRLNRDYRGLDEVTDVLAFRMLNPQDSDVSFAVPPDGVTHLGEVIISCPRAAEQAGEQGHSFEYELALLIIHGLLHLLGHDHEEPEEEARMKEKERRLMNHATKRS
ncbi:MAG: rRNA maturation RNase YbeY [Dehalococcoidia bacterium]|nr:rRNA maturation RNase YbeY [Dehalococcoidia bacterium]